MSTKQLAAGTEQPVDQPTKPRSRPKSIEGEPLTEFPEKDRQILRFGEKRCKGEPLTEFPEKDWQILRFGAFDEKRYKYLGLKPGITVDDINPNWRSEAIKLLF